MRHLYLRLHKRRHQITNIHLCQFRHLKQSQHFIPIHLSEVVVSVRLALLLPAFLLEFHLTHRHDSRCQLRIILTTLISSAQPHLVAIPLLRFRKSDDIKSIVRELKLLIVINGVNLIKA